MLPKVRFSEGESGSFMFFETSDMISDVLANEGYWEESTTWISKLFLDNALEPIVIDIGANIGSFAIPIGRHIQSKGGKVFSFEPQRITFYQLCGNIVLNRLDNVFAANKAISDYSGVLSVPEIDLWKCNNVGAFSIHKEFRELHGIEGAITDVKHEVPVIKLDDFEITQTPTIIKIDVEGHEISVINGAKNFLERHNFPTIIFEAWDFDWFSEQKKVLINTLEELGYETFAFSANSYIAQSDASTLKFDFYWDGNILSYRRIK